MKKVRVELHFSDMEAERLKELAENSGMKRKSYCEFKLKQLLKKR